MAAAGKDDYNDNGVMEHHFYRPEHTTKWESFQKAIYDKSTNQFLGRTPKNWGQLLLFYTIFYVVLAALFAICMQGLLATLNDDEPRWKLKESLIGENPGLSFRPLGSITDKDSSLISYNMGNSTTTLKWANLAEEFLKPYESNNRTMNHYVPCSLGKNPEKDKVCDFDLDQLMSCNKENSYGYNSSSPCIFLKLNRIFDWTPDYYTDVQPDMPDDLKEHINRIKNDTEKLKVIWVSCKGVTPEDDAKIRGKFSYYPREHGFPGYYYPFKHRKNYLSPIVAVEVRNVTPNVDISIECRAWAKNIEYRNATLHRSGSVAIDIRVDTDQNAVIPPTTTTLKPI